ncbi:MAG: hypothetical protein HY319_30035 [Armatimonadetes bacterium]|nr:hypothetical protein [Armatimonadota bacterium]
MKGVLNKGVRVALLGLAFLLTPLPGIAQTDEGRRVYNAGQPTPWETDHWSKLNDSSWPVRKQLIEQERGRAIRLDKRTDRYRRGAISSQLDRVNHILQGERGVLLRKNTNSTPNKLSPWLNPRREDGVKTARRLDRTNKALTIRSNWFSDRAKKKAGKPYIPGAEIFAQQAALYHVRVKQDPAGFFTLLDSLTKQEWRLSLATRPKARKAGTGYIVQAGFQGWVQGEPQPVPVVIDFRMNGQEKSWRVADIEVVSVNRVARGKDSKQHVVFGEDEYLPVADDETSGEGHS